MKVLLGNIGITGEYIPFFKRQTKSVTILFNFFYRNVCAEDYKSIDSKWEEHCIIVGEAWSGYIVCKHYSVSASHRNKMLSQIGLISRKRKN